MTAPSDMTHALVASACVAMVLATACGATRVTVTPSSSTSVASSPTAAPQTFAGNGFRTDIPTGWQDETANPSAVASLNGSGTLLMLLAALDRGLIVARTTSQPVPDDQLARYLTSITPSGASPVRPAEPVDIAGVSGVVVTFVVIPSGGVGQENEEMVVNQAGNTYEVVLSTAQTDFTQDAAGLQEVLDSWRWA